MQSMPVQPPIFFKNPTVATVLSILVTGLGQLYNGQILKGIMFLGMMAVALVLMSVSLGTLFFLPPIVWIWGIVKLLGMIVSPGNSRHFPDVIAPDPPFRRPALSP